MSSDDTGGNRINGKFAPGVSGNPDGRPLGARTKLADTFVQDVLEDWKEGGKEAIKRTRLETPARYMATIASMLPKDVNVSVDGLEALSDEQLDAIERILALVDAAGPDGIAALIGGQGASKARGRKSAAKLLPGERPS